MNSDKTDYSTSDLKLPLSRTEPTRYDPLCRGLCRSTLRQCRCILVHEYMPADVDRDPVSPSKGYWDAWVHECRRLERDIAQLKSFWDAPALDTHTRDPAEAVAPAADLFRQAVHLCRGLESARWLAERLPTASALSDTVTSLVQQNERFLELIARALDIEAAPVATPTSECRQAVTTPSPQERAASDAADERRLSLWQEVAPKTPTVEDLHLASSTLAQLQLAPDESPISALTSSDSAKPGRKLNGDALESLYREKVSQFVQRQVSVNELATWWQRLRDLWASNGDTWLSADALLHQWETERTRLKLVLLALTQMEMLTSRWENNACWYALNEPARSP